jgi:hypothetical protein
MLLPYKGSGFILEFTIGIWIRPRFLNWCPAIFIPTIIEEPLTLISLYSSFPDLLALPTWAWFKTTPSRLPEGEVLSSAGELFTRMGLAPAPCKWQRYPYYHRMFVIQGKYITEM